MHGNFDDELTRRRAARRARSAEEEFEAREEEIPRFSWSETFAMIIAAYQVLLPILLAMIGVLLFVYLLFRWAFA